MKLRAFYLFGLLGSLLLLLASNLFAQEAAPVEGDNFFQETFDSPTLAPEWFWVREDADFWNLTERPGWLRLYTQYGSLDGGVAENVLLRPAPTNPYVLTVHFEFTPTLDFQEASLLLYDDDDNYIKFSRLEHSELGGNRYLLTREVNGVKEQGSYIVSDQSDITLALQVYEQRVFGWYKDTAGNWQVLGVIQYPSLADYPNVGVTAHNGLTVGAPPPSIAADFEYIQAEPAVPLHDLLLPAIVNN